MNEELKIALLTYFKKAHVAYGLREKPPFSQWKHHQITWALSQLMKKGYIAKVRGTTSDSAYQTTKEGLRYLKSLH